MRESSIMINEIDLFYRVTGNGPALIFLHGNGEDGTVFVDAAERLSDRFTVYLIDSRGHGKSGGKVKDYQTMANDLIAFVEKLGLSTPSVVGFSDGGNTALIAASMRPSMFSKIVVCGANLKFKGCTLSFRASVTLAAVFHPSPLITLMRKQAEITPAMLQAIPCPVLVLCGERDIVKKNHSEFIAATLPNSEFRQLSGETHTSYVLNPDKLLEQITGFLCA